MEQSTENNYAVLNNSIIDLTVKWAYPGHSRPLLLHRWMAAIMACFRDKPRGIQLCEKNIALNPDENAVTNICNVAAAKSDG